MSDLKQTYINNIQGLRIGAIFFTAINESRAYVKKKKKKCKFNASLKDNR